MASGRGGCEERLDGEPGWARMTAVGAAAPTRKQKSGRGRVCRSDALGVMSSYRRPGAHT
jgi:hypothetical protein